MEIGNDLKFHIGSESWVPLDKHCNRVIAVEMKYLYRVAGRTRRDQIRNERIRENLGVTAVRGMVQMRQLKWFSHLLNDIYVKIQMKMLSRNTEVHEDRPYLQARTE